MAGRLSLLGAGKQAVAPAVWTPLSISGCSGWWDWSDSSTVFKDAGVTLASDGDTMARINDKSGLGGHWTQTTSSRTGVYKTGVQNGLNSMLNAGASRITTLANLAVLQNVPGATCAIVVSVNSTETNHGVITFGSSQNITYPRLAIMVEAGKGKMVVDNTDNYENVKNFTANTSISADTYAVIVGTVDYANTGDAKIYLNGSLDGSSSALIPTPGNTPDLGAQGQIGRYISSDYHSGYFGEMVVYQSVLSAGDRAALESYLMTKWGIS